MIEFMTSRQAAQFLGVSVSTLKKWRLEKKGPPYVKGAGKTGHPRYRRAALIDHLDGTTITPSI